MPIHEIAAPERETAKLLETLKDMISAGEVGTPALSKAVPASLSIILSTPVAFLPLDLIRLPLNPIEGGPHSTEEKFDLGRSAIVEGWRFYVSADGQTSIATVRTTSIDFRIKEISEGPPVTAVTLGLDAATRHSLVQMPTLRLWQLVVPSLYVMALWLRADAEGEDLLVPLQPTVRDFQIDVVPEAQFAEQLIELAQAARNEPWTVVERKPTGH